MASNEYSEHLHGGDLQDIGDNCRDLSKEKRCNAEENSTVEKNSEDNSAKANSDGIIADSNDARKMRAESRENKENAQNVRNDAPEPKDDAQDRIKCGDNHMHPADNCATDSQNAQKSGIQSSDTNGAGAPPAAANAVAPKRSVPRNPPVSIERLSAAQKRNVQDRELSVLLRRQGRAFSQALMTIAGTRQRSGRLWLICGATLIVIAMLLIQVRYKHRDLNLGYTLSEAISTREALLEENRKLRIELRVLSRRERLEPYATQQLGMASIRPDQILIVRRPKQADAPAAQTDGLGNIRRIDD